MIKFENVVAPSPDQWESVIMGARNPMNSWDRSDSGCGCDNGLCVDEYRQYIIGPNDHDLLMRLRNAGTDHRKFMRMLPVIVTITAPMYWWSEFDTYKIGTVANSTSKMHKMLAKPFEMNDFSFDKLPGYKNEVGQYIPDFDYSNEKWKEIGTTGYEVSDLGRIRHGTRVLAGSHHSDGYTFITIHGDQIPLHRFVACAFIPNPNNLPEVNHKDGNKKNNSAENLEWVTRSENQKHAVKMGLRPKGVSYYNGKFTEKEREKIKEMWNSEKYTKREISRIYGVSHTCINDILSDKYRYATSVNVFETIARPLVDELNELRDYYLNEKDQEKKKKIWYAILQLLPCSYNQKRTIMMNYEVLANIYKSRKDHKLSEWVDFCKWIETLPYSELVTGKR